MCLLVCKNAHISQALPQVTVDGVLVAVAFQVADDADLEGVRRQEVPQHVEDARSLSEESKNKNKTKQKFIGN